MKSFLSIFFLCVSYTYCIGQTKNSNNMTYYKNNEPRDYSKMIYSLSVNSMDCEFVVKVDDVLAFKQEQGSGGSTTFKLNQFILNNGEHTVEVEMYPLHGKHVLGDAEVILTFHRYPKNDMANSYDSFKTVKSYILNEAGEVINDISNMKRYSFSATFQATGLPIWNMGWKNSVTLQKENQAKLHKELYNEYRKIHAILKNKDLDAFLELTRPREELIDFTNCFRDIDRKARLNGINNMINAKGAILSELPEIHETHMLFEANGKLVTLLDNNNRAIIQFVSEQNNSMRNQILFKFYRKDNNSMLEVIN